VTAGRFTWVTSAVEPSASAAGAGAGGPLSDAAFELLSAKLEPPAGRPGTVARTALIDRIVGLPTVPVIAMVAPPGYGETTLLAQWARRRKSPVAWLSCDDGDNDRAVLLIYLAAALGRVVPAAWTAFQALPSSAIGIAVVPY
jgi:LuxR family transcriptional regulator, maltose regulon positive regulatory protein